mmetsp:Transcript_115313/g.372632  ORF Transcript_115313/g.372632 Transcript_115313/m.372632 type:complete len:308 (+) Transcript_115313:1245-2168(+)
MISALPHASGVAAVASGCRRRQQGRAVPRQDSLGVLGNARVLGPSTHLLGAGGPFGSSGCRSHACAVHVPQRLPFSLPHGLFQTPRLLLPAGREEVTEDGLHLGLRLVDAGLHLELRGVLEAKLAGAGRHFLGRVLPDAHLIHLPRPPIGGHRPATDCGERLVGVLARGRRVVLPGTRTRLRGALEGIHGAPVPHLPGLGFRDILGAPALRHGGTLAHGLEALCLTGRAALERLPRSSRPSVTQGHLHAPLGGLLIPDVHLPHGGRGHAPAGSPAVAVGRRVRHAPLHHLRELLAQGLPGACGHLKV